MTIPRWMQAPFLIIIAIEGIEIPGIKADSTAKTNDEEMLITDSSTVGTSDHSVNVAVVVLSVVCALAVTGLIVVLLLYIRRGRTRTLPATDDLPEEDKYYEIKSWYEFISFRRSTRKSHHYARRIDKTWGGSVSLRPNDETTVKIEDEQLYETYR
ncbi:hypothetical protein HOLleu_22876 [Holothuria leucospilota]|uniref:Uncharacterized protein n=1 Tax=Holothuria leucospilota TaxID=206669 RepID=A0A9Q1H579_HOLLE|nr:hypothetical protein HOLleu_22876 [Holothuria leucospilota]